MRITIDDSAYSSKFHDIIHSWDRYLIAYGGRGSSKTDSFYFKYLLSLFEPYYFKLAYVNSELSNIRDQQYAGFKRVAKRCDFADKLKFYDGDYRIVYRAASFATNDNMLIPKGMDDPEKTKGMDDITAIWWDEINKGTEEGFNALNELLRSPMAKYLQFAMSFNPVSELHWLRKKFFHPDDRHAVHPDYVGQMLLNRSTYKNNEFIDQEAYLETLLKSAAGNTNAIRVNVEGDWGLEINKDPWLYAYNEDKHVRPLNFFPDRPVYLSFDFNREPVTCIAVQMSEAKGGNGAFIHFIREFVENLQLQYLCERILSVYPASILYVTGDSSGNAGNVGYESRNDTHFRMIQRYLRLSDRQMNLNKKNLELHDSRLLVNTVMHNYPNVYIDPSCKVLRNDCQIATIDEKSLRPGTLLKDRDLYKMDIFDAFRYIFQTYFRDYANQVWLNK